MKNIEKYESEIANLVNNGDDIVCSIATAAGIIKGNSCSTRSCKECQKKCFEWMYSEYKESILSDEEKYIVRAMLDLIHKFGCKIILVQKRDVGNYDFYIRITFKNNVTRRIELIDSPCFNIDMFKGMVLNKKYSIEELGIELED